MYTNNTHFAEHPLSGFVETGNGFEFRFDLGDGRRIRLIDPNATRLTSTAIALIASSLDGTQIKSTLQRWASSVHLPTGGTKSQILARLRAA